MTTSTVFSLFSGHAALHAKAKPCESAHPRRAVGYVCASFGHHAAWFLLQQREIPAIKNASSPVVQFLAVMRFRGEGTTGSVGPSPPFLRLRLRLQPMTWALGHHRFDPDAEQSVSHCAVSQTTRLLSIDGRIRSECGASTSTCPWAWREAAGQRTSP